MNHRHRKTLHALFAHPLSANVDFRKVIHLLEDLGAEVDNKPGNRVGVMLNGRSAAFTHAHRDLPKEEVVSCASSIASMPSGTTPDARLRGDTRGCHGRIRPELAALCAQI